MLLYAGSDKVPKFEKPVDSMRVRIVVADESEARFYDIGGPRVPLRPAGRVENHSGRLEIDRGQVCIDGLHAINKPDLGGKRDESQENKDRKPGNDPC